MKPHALPGVAGQVEPPAPRLASAPVPENFEAALSAWEVALGLEGKAERQIRQSVAAVRRARARQGWAHPRDISMLELHALLAQMQNAGRDAKTRNNFVCMLKSFCACCKALGAIDENPVGEDTPHARETRKDSRVVPTQEEVRRLIRAARKDHRKKDRWLVYLTAATTSLRWRTLKLLEWGHVRLDDSLPHFRMPASILKNKDPRVVFMTRELAEALRQHRDQAASLGVRNRSIEGKVFSGRWVFECVPKWEGWCSDCQVAGIDRGFKGGATFSFHSLRHFASNLAKLRGLSDDQRQFQNTHATTAMTAEVYTNSSWIELGRKVQEMPGLLGKHEGGAPDGVKKSPQEELTRGHHQPINHPDDDENEPVQLAHSDAAGLAGARRRQPRSRGDGRDGVCTSRGGRGAFEDQGRKIRVTGFEPVTPIRAPDEIDDLAGECLKAAQILIGIAARLRSEVRHGSRTESASSPSPVDPLS